VSARPSLLTRPFRRVVLATHACFLAFGLTLPVLPRFVVDELGGGALAVGTVFAVHALAAVLVRPLLGGLGDRVGRRPLLIAGGVVTAVALVGHLLVGSLPVLLALRALAGTGQAAVVVGAATRSLDLAPADRQGEAASYTLVAVQLGFGLGPLLGELLLQVGGYALVWIGSALLGGAVVVLGRGLAGDAPVSAPGRHPLLHPRAVGPGIVFAIGSLGFIGFLAFVPLHADALGVTTVAPLFLVCSGTIVAVRLSAARLPDHVGPQRVAAAALLASAAGLTIIAASPAAAGLYLGALLLAVGTALFAPSMLLAAVRGTAAGERARVVATFTLFLDLASGVAPIGLGLLAARSALPVSFALAALAALVALGLVLRTVPPQPVRLDADALSEAGS
jgi:MFS family permease